MDEATPASGLSVEEVADRIYESSLPEPEKEPEATPAEPSEEVETTTEASEEVEGEETTEAVETEEVVEEPEQGEVEQFLTDLNDHFKEDSSQFENIKIPTKVNGVEGEATLSELLATHQIGEASTERLDALKADRATFEQERQSQTEAFNEQLNQAAGLVQGLEKQFTDQFENINWAELRDTDPAEYAAKQTEATQIKQQLEGYKTRINEEHNSQLNQHYQEILNRESGAILERIPEWSDNELALKEKTGIRDYLLTQEFSPSEVDGAIENGRIKSMGLVDSRLVKLARKAMLFDAGKKDVDLKTKKVRKLPKVAKPGKPEAPVDKVTKDHKDKRARLKKSGSIDDFAAILYDEIKEG